VFICTLTVTVVHICLNNTYHMRYSDRAQPYSLTDHLVPLTVSPGRMMPQDHYIDSSSNPYQTHPFPMCNIEFRFIHSPPDNHVPICTCALVSPFSCADFSLLCSPHGTSSLSTCIPRDQFTFCMDSLLLSFSPFSLLSLYEF